EKLGVKQESLFYWLKWKYSPLPMNLGYKETILGNNNSFFIDDSYEYFSAFTVAELGDMLPDYFDSGKKDNEWLCRALSPISSYITGETEANVRAKMYIYLIENGLINDRS
ncbi:MAG TPA: hypothetical protein VK553_03190, partial [Candidatus Nitrosopolaris rasttigaisensis]|nr:hypothetical protein [Candidatus Nitrosopolaris rasttigaisensis]